MVSASVAPCIEDFDLRDRAVFESLLDQLRESYPRIGPISDVLKPGFSHCYRCKTNWAFVNWHSTSFSETEGCFPLCEDCWQELQTPENRLGYYEVLWEDWIRVCGADKTPSWSVIREAVLREV